jgi:hypothetical protein
VRLFLDQMFRVKLAGRHRALEGEEGQRRGLGQSVAAEWSKSRKEAEE